MANRLLDDTIIQSNLFDEDDDEPIGAWALDELEQFAHITSSNETGAGDDRRAW